ncbi:MAG: hypothetical protein ACD_51C00117G0001, partial [uncultured bacterium]
AFISSKIQVLNSIEGLFRVNGISVENATDVMMLLLESADILLEDVESEAAILEYFQEEIDEAWTILYFINSTEYTGLTSTFDEKYDAYIRKEQDVAELKEYLQGQHLGIDDEVEITLDEAKDLVYDDLKSAGVSYSVVTTLGDSGYRLFEIEGGSVAGYDFEARYDRESELVYDLVIGEEEFATGISLWDLGEVVSGIFEEEELEFEPSDSEVPISNDKQEPTYSEKLAISLLIDYLDDYGIEIDEDNIESWDLTENLYYVIGYDDLDVELDFFVHAGDDLITDVSAADLGDVDGIFYVGDFISEIEDWIKERE